MKSITSAFLVAALVAAASLQTASARQEGQATAARPPLSPPDAQRLARLEALLERYRQDLKIPGMSAAIVKNQKVIWARGFGYADVEAKIPATEHTPFHLASLTKTFASTIIMQLVEAGKISLDDPVSKYGIMLESEGVIRVRHLLSHTSEGNPGENYRYNGNRFGELDKVIQKATGKSFAELLIANILDPLEMNETAPNMPVVVATKAPGGVEQKASVEIEAALRELIGGLNTGNVEQVARYLAPQQNSFQPEGGLLTQFVNLPDLRNAFGTGVKLNVQAQEVETAVYGDNAALTTCVLQETVMRPNAPPRTLNPYRTSLVWNRQDGAWKIVHAHQSELNGSLPTDKQRQRFDAIAKTLASPYALDNAQNVKRIQHPSHFSTAAGLMASVLDMAKYDIAIDQHRFLKPETQQLAFTPAVSTKGEKLPYGLGWFTQDYKGTKLFWHYGYWTTNSSLIVKVPDRNLTFIVMANTDNLSRPTDLGGGNVMTSPVGLAFLKTFVLPEMFGESLPEINWKAPSTDLQAQFKAVSAKPYNEIYKQELTDEIRVHMSVGRTDESTRLFKLYREFYARNLPVNPSKLAVVAEINGVADDADKTAEFTLAREQRVRVFALGEGTGGQMFDYGWIENAETGKAVWEMKEPETKHGGGASKNRLADALVTLPAGRYRLRYKTDDSHSYDRWNSVPPDYDFWGIAVYAGGN